MKLGSETENKSQGSGRYREKSQNKGQEAEFQKIPVDLESNSQLCSEEKLCFYILYGEEHTCYKIGKTHGR